MCQQFLSPTIVGIAIDKFDVGLVIYAKSEDTIRVAEFGSTTESEFTREK